MVRLKTAVSHVVTHPYPAFTTADGKLSVHQLPAATDNLVWALLPNDGSGIAAVDGPDAAAVLALCSETRRPLAAILNTHTHGDHIGINRDLEQRGMLAGLRVVGPRKVAREVPGLNEAVDEGNQVEFGGSTAHVFLTEGHKDGHISFAYPGVMFCGDKMFSGG
jgi:hydroxyacylglutathione hydrolase